VSIPSAGTRLPPRRTALPGILLQRHRRAQIPFETLRED
jgi:hypothetical protein